MDYIKNGKLSFACVRTDENGRHFAEAVTTYGSNNLIPLLARYDTANLCTSEKAARELAEFWNVCYYKNGTLADADGIYSGHYKRLAESPRYSNLTDDTEEQRTQSLDSLINDAVARSRAGAETAPKTKDRDDKSEREG